MATKRRATTQQETLEFDISKGEHRGGDPARLPAGHARRLRNVIRKDGVWDKRAQLTYDGVSQVLGLALWFDEDNKVARLVAGAQPAAVAGVMRLNVKATSGETYAVFGSDVVAYAIDDYTNLRGQMFATAKFTGSNNVQMFFLDSTAAHTFTQERGPRYSPFVGLSVHALAAFKERLFCTLSNLNTFNWLLSIGDAYPYNPSVWTLTSAVASSVTVSSRTTYSLTPTATTGAQAVLGVGGWNGNNLVWRGDLRNTSATYSVPMTAQLQYAEPWVTATAFQVGDIITAVAIPNQRMFKCTTAGTSGGAEPVWATTVGATTADNTVTWTCIGTDVLGSAEFYLPPVTSTDDAWNSFIVKAAAPSCPSVLGAVKAVLKFGNTAAGTITLTTIDFGFKDGQADGTYGKQNYGQQLTITDFEHPFNNWETSATQGAGVNIKHEDRVYWSEPLSARDIRASNNYKIQSPPGPITALRVDPLGKLNIFKRNARFVFAATNNPDIPIAQDGEARIGIGVLNPKALDTGPDGVMYGVGENFVWRMAPGEEPEDICGDAMRSEMMNKSSASWCESQASPNNRARLSIDHRNKIVYVYTQKGKLYCWDIQDEAWSTLDAGGDTSVSPVGYEICDMIYNPNTGNMYFAFGTAATGTAGLARLDESQSPAEDQISSSGTLPVYAEIWPPPIETRAPMYDLRVDDVWFHHNVTASQSGQTTKALVSFDHGQTFTKEIEVTLDPLASGSQYRPMRLPLWQGWETISLRLLHSGKGGRSSFNVSQVYATVTITRGAFPKNNPTPVSANL